jgi:hypothetical protein
MEAFEQVWETSRNNAWSWGYPTAIGLGVALLIALSFVHNSAVRRTSKVIAIVALAFVAAEFSSREVQEKWRLRVAWADAHEDHMKESDWNTLTVDGANRTLGPLIYGFQAMAMFIGVALVLSVIRKTALRLHHPKPRLIQALPIPRE